MVVDLVAAEQPPGHVLHETRLAAARGTLEQHRQPTRVGGLELGYLVGEREIVGLTRRDVDHVEYPLGWFLH